MEPAPRTLSKDGSVHVTDERFNTLSHLAGFVFSLVGSSYLIAQAALNATPWHVVGFSLYAFGLCSLFLFSTLHHGIRGSSGTERLLRTFDYLAIYLLIAGTFSPLCLVLARNPLGWAVFGVVWLITLLGIVLKSSIRRFPKWLGLGIYVILGWVAVLLGPTVIAMSGWTAGGLLLSGGVLYTIGGGIFLAETPNPLPGRFGFHEIWHLFVLAGAACHFAMMLFLL